MPASSAERERYERIVDELLERMKRLETAVAELEARAENFEDNVVGDFERIRDELRTLRQEVIPPWKRAAAR